jgi:ribosomal subunit interface protein
VTVGKDGFGFRTECAIHLDSGVTLEAEAMAADAYASADQAAIRIEKRLRRYKRRLKDRQATRPDRPRR